MVDGWTVPGFTHVQELGGGICGRVMLALDDLTQTKVAIKYLDSRLDGDEAFLSRFRAVARSLSQLEDPNVVDFYEFVESPQGTAIVMERVDGFGLRRMIATQGPTGPLAALALFSGTLLGLAAAHAKDVVHGTLRPAEILVDDDGNCRLTDFGMARAGTEAQTNPGYAAPELWGGAPAGPPADLYAATAIFFECLTGHPPYGGRSQSAISKAHREGPIPVEAVPGPLRALIEQGLAKDPERRPASAADFLGAVEDAAVDAYGPAWLAQGRSRLIELAEATARQPEPAPAKAPKVPKAPKPGKAAKSHKAAHAAPAAPLAADAPPAPAPGPAPAPAQPAAAAAPPAAPAPSPAPGPGSGSGSVPGGEGRGGGKRGRSLVIAAALAVLVIAGSTVGAAVLLGGKDDPAPVDPTGSASQPAVEPPTPANPAAGALATRIEQATAQAPGASFSYRRTGCCGAAALAKGTFGLVPNGSPSYAMSVSGSGETRRSARAILVGDVAYVMAGKAWRSAPADGQGAGYPSLVAQARWGSSVVNITALLQASTSFKKVDQVYQGTAPLDRLSRIQTVGSMYGRLAGATGAQHVAFALRLDRAGRPAHLWFRAQGTDKARTQVVQATYTGWGRRAAIAAPSTPR
ncbi:serine/threonine-protein kinase [Actinomadura rugatobispora]|uniref:non-specific serine/threonine protein kinase n=1 Tax=Actinomadura rugatobispora TaxID=1994 RepID=A0ABW0ZZD4_9ACTN